MDHKVILYMSLQLCQTHSSRTKYMEVHVSQSSNDDGTAHKWGILQLLQNGKTSEKREMTYTVGIRKEKG